ncbi:MAG: ATP-binding protein [bacterium]
MPDFEKLGVFYLGREYDLKSQKRKDELVLYDAKDLVTHAMCVGMTGSGKTGLCIGLLEEAAIDGIPALLVDPKGDLANLMLTFPELRPEDFRPWINEDDANRKDLSPDDYAAKQAELWKSGLASWGQDGDRIKKLREAVDLAVYTPGSTAGLPVSILQSFAAPPPALLEDTDALHERISSTTTSLLGLLGLEADPIKSREHILVSNILQHHWSQKQNLDLAGLIQEIQKPPMSKVGVFELESFYPAKERFELAMALNNLLAAPGFQAWLEGEALDLHQLLYTKSGKPRFAIFSIAHLSEAERMFFVSLLLNQTLSWMRGQPGTTSLRAILYMDEIFGYLPPVANPPSKAPMLTLLKQARAFGLGIVLATQNPVDLDYKAVSNIGTWFLGRLQTERDKARVLEGLEGVAASGDGKFNRGEMEQILAGLGNRVFLLHNVHEDAPVVFETRWVMSYLAGPLTRAQIKTLMDNRKSGRMAIPAKSPATPQSVALPPEVPQVFFPAHGSRPEGVQLLYQPFLLGMASVQFSEARHKIDVHNELKYLIPVTDETLPVKWLEAIAVELNAADLAQKGEEGARFAEAPAKAAQAKNYPAWKKEFAEEIFRTYKLELFKSAGAGEISRPDESERDFRIRLSQRGREQRDDRTEKLREKYAAKASGLQEKIRRAEERLQREQAQASQQKMQTAINVGATILGAVFGRKLVSRSNVGHASTAMRGASRAMKESQDVGAAEENLETLQQQLAELDAQLKAELDTHAASTDPLKENFELISIRPKKTNISVRLLALAWAPHWEKEDGSSTPAWH